MLTICACIDSEFLLHFVINIELGIYTTFNDKYEKINYY